MVRPERGSQSNQGDFNNTLTSIRVPKSSQPPKLTTVSSQAKPLVKPTVSSDTTQPINLNLVKPVVKPTMLSTTDLVGQILLQGFEQSYSGLSRNRENTVPVIKPAQPTNKRCQAVNVMNDTIKPAQPTNKRSKAVNLMNDTIKETKKTTVPSSETSTIKPRAAPRSVSWDMNKLLTPKTTDAEKIPSDLLVEQAQADIKAKRQRLSQWLSVSIRG